LVHCFPWKIILPSTKRLGIDRSEHTLYERDAERVWLAALNVKKDGDPELTAVRRPFEAAFRRMRQVADPDLHQLASAAFAAFVTSGELSRRQFCSLSLLKLNQSSPVTLVRPRYANRSVIHCALSPRVSPEPVS
jgi:hypothetical protein